MKNWSKRLLQITQNAAKEREKRKETVQDGLPSFYLEDPSSHIFRGEPTKMVHIHKKLKQKKKKLILIAQHKMCAHFEGKSIFQTIYTLPSILLMRIKAGRN